MDVQYASDGRPMDVDDPSNGRLSDSHPPDVRRRVQWTSNERPMDGGGNIGLTGVMKIAKILDVRRTMLIGQI